MNFDLYPVTQNSNEILNVVHYNPAIGLKHENKPLNPHHFSRVFPVVFQNLRSLSQTGDCDSVSHEQSSLFGCQLNVKPAATWDATCDKVRTEKNSSDNSAMRGDTHLLMENLCFHTHTHTHTPVHPWTMYSSL